MPEMMEKAYGDSAPPHTIFTIETPPAQRTVDATSPKLQWQNLTYTVPSAKNKKETQVVFENVSGSIQAGECVALMGGSGAGKTSLINALTGRVPVGELTGTILYNGRKRDARAFKQQIAFVEQHDLLYERVSVMETFMFVAKLKLSDKDHTPQQRIERANQIINDLGLSHRKDNQIITLSGGERKRVAVGMQLMTKPDILFLDEPTSGIDSFNALAMVEMLKDLCRKDGITILLTIHMPRENIVSIFDKIMVLSLGHLVWDGRMDDALPHLASLELPVPPNTNPADHLLDLCTIDHRSEKLLAQSSARSTLLRSAWQRRVTQAQHTDQSESRNVDASGHLQPISKKSELANGGFKASFAMMLWLLTARNFKELFRNKGYVIGTVMQSFLFLLIIGGIFFRLDHSQASIQSRTGVLFFMCVNLTFPNIMPLILGFDANRKIIRQERTSGLYHSSAAFLATLLSRVVLPVMTGLIYCTILYFMVNLTPDFKHWLLFTLTLELTILNAIAQGLFIGAAVPNVQLGLILAPVGQIVFMLFGGLFANASLIPSFLAWIRWISPIRYSYTSLMQNEFRGLYFDCAANERCIASGDEVLDKMDMMSPSVQTCCLALLGWTLFYLPLGLFALYKTTKPKMKFI